MNVDLGCLSQLFGGDSPASPLRWYQIALRGAFVYLVGLVLVRLGKSRLLSKATPLDVILAFVLGSVLSRGINGTASLSGTVVAAATLIGLHWWFTRLACSSDRWGWLIKGESKLLVKDGIIDWENMRSSHISEGDLMEELRLQANCEGLEQVKTAFKERSGDIGVVKKPPDEMQVSFSLEDGTKTVRIIVARE
jgi:uncharacterized membrane protein YcaP (DUF421 family)